MVLVKKEAQRPMDLFDQFFDLWPEQWHRPVMMWQTPLDDLIRVDRIYGRSYPGDSRPSWRGSIRTHVDVVVEHGILRIAAERRDEKTVDDKAYRRRELRYGAFRRENLLPEGATADDVKAAYKDGVLEIRVTLPQAGEPEAPAATKIPVTTT